MMRVEKDGGSEPLGEGEQQEKARRSRKSWIMGGTFVIGMASGAVIGARQGERIFDSASGWPPALSIAFALIYVLVVMFGGYALSRQTDEFEMQRNYKAASFAAFVYAMVYPVWLVLWFGRLLPEPMHGALFVAFLLSVLAASLFYRFR